MQHTNIIVSGKVQGVSYRRFVQMWAESIGLFGWCRNLDDGSVEVVIEGDKEKIDALICKLKEGPEFSHVTDVVVLDKSKLFGYSSFEIRR